MNQISIKHFSFFFLLLASFVITGCAQIKEVLHWDSPKNVPSDQAKTYVYQCADDFSFNVSADNDQAWIYLADQIIKLPHIPAASGVKYSNRQATFWSKGQEASLIVGSQTYTECKNNPEKSVWENAKLHGVNFRAVGNEPNWLLEIFNREETIIFAYYGENVIKHVFNKPDKEIDHLAGETIYVAKNTGHLMIVTIIDKNCLDNMSGKWFEFTTIVQLDETKFYGCGMSLQ